MEQRHPTLLRAFSGHLTSTLAAVCVLQTQPRWSYLLYQTYNARRPCLSSGFCTCMEQFAVIRQECAVADDVPSWSEDCTFSVVVRSSLGDRNCTIYCNYCLPAVTGYQPFCLFFLFLLVSDCAVPLQCLWHESVTLISTCLIIIIINSQCLLKQRMMEVVVTTGLLEL